MSKKTDVSLLLKGAAMGMAEVVPGVSGGTIAFITGIYDRLIDAIKGFDAGLWKAWRQEGFQGVWKRIDGTFLFTLLAGMLAGLVAGVFGISYLLEHYPVPLWSFFFGLILASVVYVGSKSAFGLWQLLFLVLGAAVALGIVMATPSSGKEALWFVFLSGALAVSALMLPGISGSFILLLLGMYSYVLPTVKDFLSSPDWESFQVLAVFGLGMLTGLVLFSHLLSYLLHHWHQQMYALLAGFMLGSLYKIWPWQQILSTRINSRGEEVPLLSKPVLPAYFDGDPMLWWGIGAMLLGVLLVWGVGKLGVDG